MKELHLDFQNKNNFISLKMVFVDTYRLISIELAYLSCTFKHFIINNLLVNS